MMRQLGIRALRPGAKANPYPHLPQVLTLKDASRVSTADAWWMRRRPEIVEDFFIPWAIRMLAAPLRRR